MAPVKNTARGHAPRRRAFQDGSFLGPVGAGRRQISHAATSMAVPNPI